VSQDAVRTRVPPVLGFAGAIDEAKVRRAIADLSLSPRRAQVLTASVHGVPRARLARELGLSETTIKAHVRGLLRHMGERSLAAAVWTVRKRAIQLREEEV